MNKIIVIGTTGSGKSTVAKKLRYEARMIDPAYKHITFHRLRSKKEVANFINKTSA
jgi:adenylate kinase family enzyme